MSLDIEKLKQFVRLSEQKSELEGALEVVKKNLAELEPEILEGFEELGAQNMNIDGRTVYIHSQIWAGSVDGNTQALVDSLKANGHGDLVKEQYNSNTLSAWVRELLKNGEEIPAPIQPHINITEKFSVRTRKA